MSATIELHGLELHGFHGVLEEERRDGQRFVYDLRIEDAADYRDVVACVRELNDVPRQLLETLATAVAETLLERFDVERVRVRVRKPDVALPVEFSAVTVERP